MKKEDDTMPIPKAVLQLTRWRWWMLAGSMLYLFGIIDRLQTHTVAHGFLDSLWIQIFGCAGNCMFTAMIWYTHFYWKRHTP